jgi:predicted HTH transcriptional regulator
MDSAELLKIIERGESSTVQFKERLPHIDSLAHELIAFANTGGGYLLIGVNDKTGDLKGLSFSEIQQSNSQIVNTASQKIFPPIGVITETISILDQNIIVVKIEEGSNKPYKDRNGIVYVKNGADKRKVTSNDELARLLREGGSLYADEMLVNGSSVNDIDLKQFDLFLFKKYNKTLDELGSKKLNAVQILENLNLARNGEFLLAGLLSFSTKRQFYHPQFSIQCVSMDGTIISDTFSDSENAFEGTILEVFKGAMDFIGRNMKKLPESNGFNSTTKWEIPYEVFEELLVNALVHRDYFISSTVKIFIFSDKVEIVSPGKLPNSLTIENIKNGVSIIRNPILLSTVQYILPFKGLGTGIMRSFSLYPDITMANEINKNQFKVIIRRPVLTDSGGIEWTQMLDKLFGPNIPESVKWTRREDIIKVLSVVGLTKYKNHAFLPGGGGLDLFGANLSSAKDCIELDLNGCIYICKPASLQFESFTADNTWFYFRLETDTMKPKFENSSHSESEYEDLMELTTGEFVEREKENDDNVFKNFYRYVTIILSGSIVIFSKWSRYNAVSSTYDGRHNKMSADAFRQYISKAAGRNKLPSAER